MLSRKDYTGIGLTGLYDAIARQCKKNPENTSYDSKCVTVSQTIQTAVKEHMASLGIGKGKQFASVWASHGPKVDDSLPDGAVVIETEFFKKLEDVQELS